MQYVEWQTINDQQKRQTLSRPSADNSEQIEQTRRIIDDVKHGGDERLYQLTAELDGVALDDLAVPEAWIDNAWERLTVDEQTAIYQAYNRIWGQHQALMPQDTTVDTGEGIRCQRVNRPLSSVGLYVPGGAAPLVSTLLMLAVPAQLAGCPNIVVCTPPGQSGEVDSRLLAAASLCGINQIFRIGGAQAIAAMAYGTAAVPKTQRIFGPGNSWVDQAKRLVAQDPIGARIDLPAGPSEVLVIADDSAEADWAAADLLAQAEHGPDSQVILLTTSKRLARSVMEAVERQAAQLPRYDVLKQSLAASRVIVVPDLTEAFAISNAYAPEHLILQLTDPEDYLTWIEHAGTVFVGHWTPETMGDYITGSNHVLPTGGHAKAYSGLAVNDFMRAMNIQYVDQRGIRHFGSIAGCLADIEGLHAHKRAVDYRLRALADDERDD